MRLVSATFVARITRRRMPATCDRSNTRCCSAADSRPYSGSTSVGAASFAYMPRTASAASRISASPGRNTRTSPAGSRSSSRRAGRDAVDVVGLVRFSSGPCRRAVADLHGVGASRHLDDGRRGAVGLREVLGEALRVDRRAGDDDLEIGALGEDPPQVPEQEVDVERPLVGLVDDDHVVAAQQSIAMDLVEQDPVGHERDARLLRHLVGEAHLVPDGRAERHLHLLGDALGDGPRCDAAGLRVGDARAAEFQRDLRELGRLARPGGAGHDDDLVVADRARDLVPRGADGELRRERDDGCGRRHSLRSYPVRRAGQPLPVTPRSRASATQRGLCSRALCITK